MEDPTAYSDYYADIQLISTELQAEGIDATVDGVQASQWYTDSADGNFQVIEHWGNGGVTPYVQYGERRLRSLRQRVRPDGARDVGEHQPIEHECAEVRGRCAAEPRVDPGTRRSSALRGGLGRVLHGKLHRLRDGPEPLHGPVAR